MLGLGREGGHHIVYGAILINKVGQCVEWRVVGHLRLTRD
jgi:hypothetical protein